MVNLLLLGFIIHVTHRAAVQFAKKGDFIAESCTN